MIRGSAVGISVLVLVAVLQALPFLRVVHDHPEAERTPALVALYSPPPKAFLAAPSQSYLWDGPTASIRDSLRAPVEQSLFPGVVVVLLALLGLASRRLPRCLCVCGWPPGRSSAPSCPSDSRTSRTLSEDSRRYRLLYDYAPGWDGFRTPGRLNTLTSLGLALLAAAGAALILRHVGSRAAFRMRSSPTVAALVTTGVLTGVVLMEGFGPIPHPRVPPIPAGQIGAPGPQLHLPSDDLTDVRYRLPGRSRAFRRSRTAGARSRRPGSCRFAQIASTFPDASSVEFLRGLGLRTVILHPDLAFRDTVAGHGSSTDSGATARPRGQGRGDPLSPRTSASWRLSGVVRPRARGPGPRAGARA